MKPEETPAPAVAEKNTAPAIGVAMLVAAVWMFLTPGLEQPSLQGSSGELAEAFNRGRLEGQLVGEALTASLIVWAVVYFVSLRRSGRKRGLIAFVAIASAALLANAVVNLGALL